MCYGSVAAPRRAENIYYGSEISYVCRQMMVRGWVGGWPATHTPD